MVPRRQVKPLLDYYTELYNQPAFIEQDPISIPHQYSRREDIEITGFWTAIFSWGQRKTIINKARELFNLMDNAPHDFVVNHSEKERQKFASFVHRTFQYTDTLYFLAFLQQYYQSNQSLEELFLVGDNEDNVARGLIHFHREFFSLPDSPARTRKHISTPSRNSTCKRINMFLRWMVRQDDRGVDFGIWDKIKPAQLLIPLDVHVDKVARKLNLIQRKQTDWKAVVELTKTLKEMDPDDPTRYDFALFGLGVLEKDLKNPFFPL